MSSHTGEKKFACSEENCKMMFSTSTGLKSHLFNAHNIGHGHACSQPGCARKFGTPGHLKRHVDKDHLHLKTHACEHPKCDKSFNSATELRNHMTVHNTGPKKYNCNCGFENDVLSRWNAHQKICSRGIKRMRMDSQDS
jgi:uncharacterized Zn-finger protein